MPADIRRFEAEYHDSKPKALQELKDAARRHRFGLRDLTPVVGSPNDKKECPIAIGDIVRMNRSIADAQSTFMISNHFVRQMNCTIRGRTVVNGWHQSITVEGNTDRAGQEW
jgi:hypothetical protein